MNAQTMKTQTNAKERWVFIDLIECIAMLFVVICHWTSYSFDWLNEPRPLYFARYFLRTIISTCVPLFFFANGYLLLNRPFDLKRHIIKSVRIVVLTFVWGLIHILCLVLLKNEPLSVREIIQSLWSWRQGWINHLWYMGALICIYVFVPLLKLVFDTNRKVFVYFTVMAAIFTFGNALINRVGTMVLNCVQPRDSVLEINWFTIFNPFKGIYGYTFVYFCVGGLAHGFKDRILSVAKRKRNVISVIALLCGCLALYAMGVMLSRIDGELWDVIWHGYDSVSTFVNVIAIFVLSLSYRSSSAPIRLVSRNTLGIYFIHNLFVQWLLDPMMKIPFFDTFTGCVVFSVFILSISLLCALAIKKIPIVQNLLRI